tara:strand:- start:153 stop:326 length:174 start_codon:yes stop_codon:yes gene_type:complete
VTVLVRKTKAGQTEFVEVMKIEQKENRLELRLRIFNAELKPFMESFVFKSIEQGPSE